ncbi:MAG: VWA domain-containing protein [Ardenticatenales bacterium]|nr:VWA domain-containing protein [Ardenticatenales bacterium]
MSTFRFASPEALVLLLAVPLLALAPRWRRRRTGVDAAAALRVASTAAVGRASAAAGHSLRQRLYTLLGPVRLVALALAVIALARPQSGQARETIQGEGIDIALALDISGSMAALDFEPDNRLAAAKAVIKEFVESRQYDRLGLVVFAREAFDQCPITVDHSVLLRQLDQVKLSTELGIEDGTAIGLGLANAAAMLKDQQAKSKIIVLLTDGVNNVGQIDPLTAAEAARALGIKVYTIAAARSGQVPVPVDGFFGPRVAYQESQIDEETLRAIADATGGAFFRAQDTAALREIYAQIDKLEKSTVELRQWTRYRELFAWWLGPALALWCLELVLRRTALRTLP